MEFNYNMDIKTRDEMIFGKYEPDKYLGGVRYFKGMTVKLLKELVDNGFADPEECQNYSPSVAEFIEFMEGWDGYRVNGYVVTDKRDDYRVSVEAIEKNGVIETKEELVDFVETFRFADDFDANGYAWWD